MSNQLQTIMLIDDDSDTNMIVEHYILKDNLAKEVVTAMNGEEALTFLRNNAPPELILLDINMPRMNGWEFLEEFMKIDEKLREIMLVVMVSVSLNPEDAAKAKKYNVTFVNKPLTPSLIKSLAEQAVVKITAKSHQI